CHPRRTSYAVINHQLAVRAATHLQGRHASRRSAESRDLTLKFPSVRTCRTRGWQSQSPRVNIQEEPRLHILSLARGCKQNKIDFAASRRIQNRRQRGRPAVIRLSGLL